MRRRWSLLAAAIVAVALVACDPTTSWAGASANATIQVGETKYGAIILDGRGYALYAFTGDRRGRATCYGACAKRWPPVFVRARLEARKGAKASLMRVTRRHDGRLQATHAGHPLYYYVGDTAPGVILCQNVSEFGGIWLVLRGSGKPVR